jgi:hypothetical protein
MAVLASPAIQLVPIKPGGVRLKPPAQSSALPMRMAATWPLAQQRFMPGDQVTLPLSENPPAARVGLFWSIRMRIAPTEVQDGQPSP